MNIPHSPRWRRSAVLACGIGALGVATLVSGCGNASTTAKSAAPAPHTSSSATPSHSSAAKKNAASATKSSPATKSSSTSTPSVTMIGDSITVRSENALWDVMPQAKINGQVGRQLTTAPGLVAQARQSGTLGKVLVIALGTNGNGGTAELNQAIDAAGPHHKVVLVTIDAARPWQDTVNSDIRQVAASRSDVTVADWHHTIAGKEYMLVDGVHPDAQGSTLFARTVVDAVHQAAS